MNIEKDDNSCHWSDCDDELFLNIDSPFLQGVADDTSEARAQDEHSEICSAQRLKQQKSQQNEVKELGTDESVDPSAAPPLERFRKGYLWVSDLSAQSWCEQQMEYGFTLPLQIEEKPEMRVGSDMHLQRELEVQDVVSVKVTSDEDIFGIKVLNLLGAVESFLVGIPVRREIPIFGAPFGEDVFMIGMIDEIRCDPDTFDLDLIELKTRQVNSLPSRAQSLTHHIQVMIYKKLFDDIVTGTLTKEVIVRHLHLTLDKEFGDDVKSHVGCQGLDSLTLGDLLDKLFSRFQAIPCISQQLLIEYCHQKDNSTIGVVSVPYDENFIKQKFQSFVHYWRGERKACGVEIEDAWKCQKCQFADACSWRQEKAELYAKRNAKRDT